ncbi:hypothetical protein [Plantactinospora sp. BB1]|uniref:hypothetical protein n=1 Tax=Plantactinospora sp. BB1 TaxID=2071627 RepID=UPI00131EF057|nr:hypothetical protein [Plantactinospora sp. BB1]
MRRSRRALPAAVAALALLVGCSAEGDSDGDGSAGTSPGGGPVTASTGPATSAPSRPAGSPSPSAGQVIASSALLQPEDLGGARLEPLPEGDNAHLRPTRPCAEPYPSDATRSAAVAMRAYVSPGQNETPRVVLQYVGLHPGHGGAAFAEIAAAVRRCPGGLGAGQHRWEVAETGVAGDESMLLRVSARFSYGDEDVVSTTPAVLARVGDHVTVVADLGWESASGAEPYVRDLAAKAVERLRAAE